MCVTVTDYGYYSNIESEWGTKPSLWNSDWNSYQRQEKLEELLESVEK